MRVRGQWRYLYRVVDTTGQTTDFLLTTQWDREAALRFLTKAIRRHGVTITIHGSKTNAAAIRSDDAEHGTPIAVRHVRYRNTIVEQDYRAVKRLVRPVLRLKSVEAAQRTLAGSEHMHMLKKGHIVVGEGTQGQTQRNSSIP
jgi:putative transposase